jgi:hypothetical protein
VRPCGLKSGFIDKKNWQKPEASFLISGPGRNFVPTLGLPDFLCKTYQSGKKIKQITIKYTK